MNLDRYHEHHADIRGQLAELRGRIGAGALAQDPDAARKALVSLVAKLNIHLAFEDTALYPTLLNHRDPRVRDKSRHYMEDMGGIKEEVKAHLGRWLSEARVRAEPDAFRRETEALLAALERRLQAEDTDFYPLVEAV